MAGLRRTALYGVGGTLLTGLVYAGWFHRAHAANDTMLSCASFEMSVGLFASAESKVATVLQSDPRSIEAILISAHCREQLGNHAGSVDRYRQALSLATDPDQTAEIRIALAMEANGREAFDEAQGYLKLAHARRESATFTKLTFVRGLVAESAGDRAAAAEAYASAGEIPCGDPWVALDALDRLCGLDRADEAERRLDALRDEKSIADEAFRAHADYARGKLKFAAGKTDTGSDALRRIPSSQRGSLTRQRGADARFWELQRSRGAVPSDLKWLVEAVPKTAEAGATKHPAGSPRRES